MRFACLFAAWGACALAGDLYLSQIRPLLQANCTACHSGRSAQGGLDLTTPDGILRGGKRGAAVVPGDAGGSLLYRAVTHAAEPRMPLGKPKLSADAIARLAEWIQAGAAFPKGKHWAFQVPVRPAVPAVRNSGWIRNPIDAFIAEAHEKNGLAAAGPAEKRVLLRRVYIDLTGLPPTPAETDAFLADPSPDAYEKVVDSLLQSPRYGERWGRHWMDVWRYSDWYGYRRTNEVRNSQRHIWQWRDWIVESLNQDKGYDRMIAEMIAGDEIAPADPKVLRATGYLVRSYKRFDRDGWLQDVVDHTAMGFLGVTLKCARCHDHKYDPFSQEEYYRFRAFFEPYDVRLDRVPGETDLEKAGLPRAFDAKAATPTYLYVAGDVQNPDKSRALAPALPAVLGSIGPIDPVDLPLEARYPDIRDFVHRDLVAAAKAAIEKTATPQARAAAEAHLKALEARIAADKARHAGDAHATDLALAARKLERHALVLKAESDLTVAVAKLAEALKAVRPDGEVDEKKVAAAKAEVDRAQAALGKKLETYTPLGETYPEKSSGRRLALARWIASRDNPLTARVAINHIWARHFGRGIVASMFDFGQYGKPPSHPALLDWLAVELMERNWSMKAIHRLIVTSSTYRMQSGAPPGADPDNRLLSRMNPKRMEAEVVRDSVLHLAGQLDPAIGGVEVDHTAEEDSRRRSLYIRQAPDLRAEFLAQFDAPNPNECYERGESVVPQQALSLANSRLTQEQARTLARTLPSVRFVDAAFQTILNRAPTPLERDEAASFLARQSALLAGPERLTPFTTGIGSKIKPSADPAQRARENLVQVLFNLNEFVTIR